MGQHRLVNSFFEEHTERSVVKANIVAKYVWAWARIIMPAAEKAGGRIGYIDLFAGPGQYRDGTKSTPLRILERTIADPCMRRMLVTVFNDVDSNNSRALQAAIAELPGVGSLKYQPVIHNEEVGNRIVELLEEKRLIPTLVFVDPWGYKGLSIRLINSVLRNWGSECIFFFNYNRVNMGLNNEVLDEHMNALFGTERANGLRRKLLGLTPEQRELTIIQEIAEALRENGAGYFLTFRFAGNKGDRTSHYLLFVTKHPKGYMLMKEIMAGESSTSDQGVPSLEYCPEDARQPMLFGLSSPIDELAGMLLTDFAGQQLTMQEIYLKHNIGRLYIGRNYKAALRQLESEGKIIAQPGADCRIKRRGEVTFGDKVKVTFPARRG